MVWRGWDNAEIYHRFVSEHRIYRRLNQRMVELADLVNVRHVLDLGCGTGATALACLRVLDMDADLTGVDASEEMVEVARANILDPRARFHVAPASAVHAVVQGRFDRALCNAAFWQFPAAGPVFESLGRVLEPGARFVFNVPAERVEGERHAIHPFQIALARSLESRTGRRFEATSLTALSRSRIQERAADHGFTLEDDVRFTYTGVQRELMDLMTIPAMIGPLADGLSDKDRDQAVQEARDRSDPDEEVQVPWVFFLFKFRGQQPKP